MTHTQIHSFVYKCTNYIVIYILGCKEKFAEGCIPVVDAKDIEVVTNIDEELVCHAEILEAAEALDKSDKEVEQALKEEWIVVRIEGHSETFGTLHFAASDEGEGEQ